MNKIDIKEKQKGATLITAILLLSVTLAITLAISGLTARELVMSGNIVHSTKAYFAAESGAEKALYDIRSGVKEAPLVPPDSPIGEESGLLPNNTSWSYEAFRKREDIGKVLEVSCYDSCGDTPNPPHVVAELVDKVQHIPAGTIVVGGINDSGVCYEEAWQEYWSIFKEALGISNAPIETIKKRDAHAFIVRKSPIGGEVLEEQHTPYDPDNPDNAVTATVNYCFEQGTENEWCLNVTSTGFPNSNFEVTEDGDPIELLQDPFCCLSDKSGCLKRGYHIYQVNEATEKIYIYSTGTYGKIQRRVDVIY
ncbi:hypothetical protein COY23_00770 [bacterium (Candidatus Torokbacteria) CG_4_10_14_0_2_um_filter_35_8]|nr:MAG: hypothetical protein COY23_00770 [bacterium (Candidatus Torokbacteria) CG_4_10_14_0_2_um_filter_35_8]